MFEEKKYTIAEIKKAISVDFEGFERMRLDMENVPKFGNDIDEVDLIAADISEFFCQKVEDFSKELHNILDEQFNPDRPNAVWCTDITYIYTLEGFAYLTSVMDLYSRKIISWVLAPTLETRYVVEAINQAKARRTTDQPLILHSDRGTQYVSQAYREATEKFQLSFSRRSYPYDNACIESFHSLIKREWLNRFSIDSFDRAYTLVFEYIEAFYNTVRIHSHCDYMSPDQFERLYKRVAA